MTGHVNQLLRDINNNSLILEGLAFEEVTEILAPNYFTYMTENQPVYYYVQQAPYVQVTTAQATLLTPVSNVYCKSAVQGIKVYAKDQVAGKKEQTSNEQPSSLAYSNNLLTDRIRLL